MARPYQTQAFIKTIPLFAPFSVQLMEKRRRIVNVLLMFVASVVEFPCEGVALRRQFAHELILGVDHTL